MLDLSQNTKAHVQKSRHSGKNIPPSPLASPAEPVSLPIRCRPDQGFWVLVLLFIGLFALSLWVIAIVPKTASGPGIWLTLSLYALLLVGLPLLCGVWLSRAIIVADEQGLRWRGMGKWHFAVWEDVTDYYSQSCQRNSSNGVLSVLQIGHTCFKFDSGPWQKSKIQQLKSAVTQYAVNARATEWKMLGTRPELDWPRTFRYDTLANRWLVHQVGLILTGFTFVLFFPWHLSSSMVSWKAALSFGAVAGSLSWLAFKMWVIWKVKQAVYQRFDEQITVTQEAICWLKHGSSVTVVWDEIVDYCITSEGLMGTLRHVVTLQGNIDFHSTIQDVAVLDEIILQQTGKDASSLWREMEALGGVGAKWSSGREGIGDRIYHYRTRCNRAVLWLPTGMMMAFPLTVIIKWIAGLPVMINGMEVMIFVCVGVLPVLWFWYRYWCGLCADK